MRLLVIGITTAAAAGVVAAAPAHADQAVPAAARVSQVLTALTDPGTPDQAKKTLVQGGIGADERRAFGHDRLKMAANHGELPLSFDVGNIWPVGPNTAAAQVTLAGPKLQPTAEVFTFVDQGGWMLSSDSAAALIQSVTKG